MICMFCLLINSGCSHKINQHQESGVISYLDQNSNTFLIETGPKHRIYKISANNCIDCKMGDYIKFTHNINQNDDELEICDFIKIDSSNHHYLHADTGRHKWGHIKPSKSKKDDHEKTIYLNENYLLIKVKLAIEDGEFNCTEDVTTQTDSCWISERDFIEYNLSNVDTNDLGKCAVIGFLRDRRGIKVKLNDFHLLKEVLSHHPIHTP